MRFRSFTPMVLATLLMAAIVPGMAEESDAAAVQSGNSSPRQPAVEDRAPRPVPTTNVRVELTVTDSIGGAAPQKKSVAMLVADGLMGRIRAQTGGGGGPVVEPTLNVDATPTLLDGRVRLQVSLDYAAPPSGAEAIRLARVTEFATVLLESGKPVVISESADPAVDRKVTVQVTATVLK